MKDWIFDNIGTIGTYLGLGGAGAGGGLLSKLMIDKKQNAKIKSLDKRVSKVETDLQHNTEIDKLNHKEIGERLTRIEDRGEMIYNHLLNKR